MLKLTTEPFPVVALPLRPEVALPFYRAYLQTELDAAATAAAAPGTDPAFRYAHAVHARALQAALNHLDALWLPGDHTTALIEHERRRESLAALGARAVLAMDDENRPHRATAVLAITSRARHAAQLRHRPWWRRLLERLAVWRR